MHPGITVSISAIVTYHSVDSLSQGTPAFIAEVLARSPPPRAKFKYVSSLFFQELNDDIPAHPLEDMRISDMEFFDKVAGFQRLDHTWISHQAIHDAESIFWVILFFMIRANPKGSNTHKSMLHRSTVFDAIVGHRIGGSYGSRKPVSEYTAGAWADLLPEKLQRFSEPLESLADYFSLPWHGIQVPLKHQFHAHNFLQRWLIHEIKQLTEELKDPIQLELVPLPVRSHLMETQFASTLRSLNFRSVLKRSHTEDDKEDGPVKRIKYEQSQAEDIGDVHPYVHLHYVINLY
jgi:hypothetical protein